MNELAMQREVSVLDPDKISDTGDYAEFREELRASEPGLPERTVVYRYLLGNAILGLGEGAVVVWNQAFTDHEGVDFTIRRLMKSVSGMGRELDVLVVEMEVPYEVALARIGERAANGGHGVTPERLDMYFGNYSTVCGLGYVTLGLDGLADPDENARVIWERIDGREY